MSVPTMLHASPSCRSWPINVKKVLSALSKLPLLITHAASRAAFAPWTAADQEVDLGRAEVTSVDLDQHLPRRRFDAFFIDADPRHSNDPRKQRPSRRTRGQNAVRRSPAHNHRVRFADSSIAKCIRGIHDLRWSKRPQTFLPLFAKPPLVPLPVDGEHCSAGRRAGTSLEISSLLRPLFSNSAGSTHLRRSRVAHAGGGSSRSTVRAFGS